MIKRYLYKYIMCVCVCKSVSWCWCWCCWPLASATFSLLFWGVLVSGFGQSVRQSIIGTIATICCDRSLNGLHTLYFIHYFGVWQSFSPALTNWESTEGLIIKMFRLFFSACLYSVSSFLPSYNLNRLQYRFVCPHFDFGVFFFFASPLNCALLVYYLVCFLSRVLSQDTIRLAHCLVTTYYLVAQNLPFF